MKSGLNRVSPQVNWPHRRFLNSKFWISNIQIFTISQPMRSNNCVVINRHYNFIYLKLIFDPFKCVMGFNFTQVTIPGRFLFGHNWKPIAGIGWITDTEESESNRQKGCNCLCHGIGLRSGVKTLTIKPMLINVEWFT